jgi:DNA polymerase-3 subunit beta
VTATIETAATVAVPRSELARALKAASAVKAKHVHVDLTGETAVISGYTPETAVRVTLDAPITEPAGEAFVLRTMLAGILPYLGSDVRLGITETQITVEADESVFEIRTARVDAAPPPRSTRRRRRVRVTAAPEVGTFGHAFAKGKRIATFEAPILAEVLRRVLPFASRDMTRPILATMALYPEACCAAATDSYRLAVIRYGDGPVKPTEEPILLRVGAAAALGRLLARKLGKVTINATTTHYTVAFEDTRWSILRLPPVTRADGERGNSFPSWWNLLPDSATETKVKVDREDMLTAARAAAALSPRNAPLKLKVSHEDGAAVSLASPDRAAMTRKLASADVFGESMEIGFNPDFMADVCAVAPVERLTVKLISPLRPALIEAARDQYLLMPIRLNV